MSDAIIHGRESEQRVRVLVVEDFEVLARAGRVNLSDLRYYSDTRGRHWNTAIAAARDPVLMASAMKKAVEAGREAFRAGRMPRKRYASASSPIDGTFF